MTETEDEQLDLAEARRLLLETREENARLRAELQQLHNGVRRPDEDTITP